MTFIQEKFSFRVEHFQLKLEIRQFELKLDNSLKLW